MNDRILGALQVAGIKDAPLASLDHEQQFFALTPHMLLYQAADPASPLQQVTLREISRIHSDHQGTLRVETGHQTSITASLLGFDPHRVQRFFQTVRDTTARAKQQPSSPLPSVGSKMFGPAPTAPAAASGPLASAPSAAPSEKPASTSPDREPTVLGKDNASGSQPAASGQEAGGPKVVKIGGAQPQGSQSQDSQPKGSPDAGRLGAPAPISVTASPAAKFNKPQTPVQPPAAAAVLAAGSAQPGEANSDTDADTDAAHSSTPALSSGSSTQRLARSAQTVGGLRVTVRALALVLVLGALGMGYVLWQQGQGSQIQALWTVTMGVVTSVALLVLAEVLKLLSALGQAVSQQRGGSSGGSGSSSD